MADATVSFINEAQVLASIRELAGVIGTAQKKPQKVVAIELIKGIQQGFRDEMSPEGVPWDPLKFRSGKILQDHRILYHSITSEINGDTVTVGTNDKRAAMLHFGSRITPKKGRYLAIMLPGMEYRGPLRTTYPGAFVLAGKSFSEGHLWLVTKNETGGTNSNSSSAGNRGTLNFIALLVRYVQEPGRPFVGASTGTQDRIIARLEELARKAWEEGNAPDVGP